MDQLPEATLDGRAGRGRLYVKRSFDGSITEAAGRWVYDDAARPEDLFEARDEERPLRYVGPIDDSEIASVAEEGEAEARIALIQERKNLDGDVTGYIFILDPVLPLAYEADHEDELRG